MNNSRSKSPSMVSSCQAWGNTVVSSAVCHPTQLMSSIAVTMDVYGHLFPSDAEDLADKLDAMFRDSQTDKTIVGGRRRQSPKR